MEYQCYIQNARALSDVHLCYRSIYSFTSLP